uniref:Cytochrome P450 CYP71-2 n=1 Tax=Daphne genkwa TaxID=1477590 RepID=A0A977LFS4_9ROSI|nr:cytochrome P450 CYP71-2 [Daphne genkwa]
MDFPLLPSLIPFLLFILFIFIFKKTTTSQNPSPKLPPGPFKLPILGNALLLFSGTDLTHITLAKLAKKYGPLMHLQFGELPFIIVSSPKVAKDVLKTHDIILSSRPELPSQTILTYGNTNIESAPYGEYWRQVRKVAIVELLSIKRVQSFAPIRDEVLSNMVQAIAGAAGSLVDLTHFIYSAINEIVSKEAFGDIGKLREEFIHVAKETGELFAGLALADVFPSKKFLFVLTGRKRACEKALKRMDVILTAIIEGHKVRYKEGTNDNHEIKNLLHVLLDIQASGQLRVPLTTDNIKSVMSDAFGAGSDTSSSTVEWAMTEMLREPRTLEKAQAEVRSVFKNKAKIDEESLEELTYMKSVIKETLRMHPPPLTMRESLADCELNGFHIPAKTLVVVNQWAIGRDPNYWTEPDRFYPDRFLESSVDFKGNHFEFIPFGAGRRICPGMALGVANAERLLAELLYHFDWKLPDGMRPQDLDTKGIHGFVIRKKNRLLATPVPYVK